MNLKNFNDKLAVWFTQKFGSMWTVYVFILWSILPFFPAFSKYKDFILYISAGFIQLVALPLIMVGGNVLGKITEERDIRDSETIAKEFEIVKQELDLHKQELVEIKELHKELHDFIKDKE